MASFTVLQRAVESAARLSTARLDADTVRSETLGILLRTFPAEGWAWAVSDPVSQLAAAAVPNHPLERHMFRILASEENPAQLNRRAQLIASRTAAAALNVTTDGHPERSDRWRTFMSPEGIGDELRIIFADRAGCWGYVDLYSDAHHCFDDDNVATAHKVSRLLTAALRRASLADPEKVAVQDVPESPAVLTITPSMTVLARTESAGSWLPELAAGGNMPLPCAVVAAAARATVSAVACTVRQYTRTGRWVSVYAARLDTGDIAVTIGPSTREEVLDYRARACALTAREREVLGLLQRGYDTRAVARTLVISEATAHDHVKNILRKTNRTSRSALLASAEAAPGSTR